AAQAVQFTVEKQGSKEVEPVIPHAEQTKIITSSDILPVQSDGAACSMQDGCISCGS
ncbi:MAG: ribonucleoside-diphosphate reductase, partial [Segetibacter sp.]|nr:ribonucleoside-diphosphate reductase [Segetibacter sp.]